MKLAPLEERIYRHRCVEGWSIVVPWIGFSLSTLIDKVQPTSKAKYVQFSQRRTSRRNARTRQRRPGLALPRRFAHGRSHASARDALLRPVRRGAAEPERRACSRNAFPGSTASRAPRPSSSSNSSRSSRPPRGTRPTPNEYGFYSNVNPTVDHPRWSQATERRLGGSFGGRRIKTQMFNGYRPGRQSVHRHGPAKVLLVVRIPNRTQADQHGRRVPHIRNG